MSAMATPSDQVNLPFYRDVAPRVVNVAAPAAAADWSASPPGGMVWHLQSVTATLTTDANAANRLAELRVTDGSTVLWRLPAVAVQVAGGVSIYSWINGAPAAYSVATVLRQVVPLPTVPLFGGHALQSLTTNVQVGDQWSAIVLYVYQVEWRQMAEKDAYSEFSQSWRRAYGGNLLEELG